MLVRRKDLPGHAAGPEKVTPPRSGYRRPVPTSETAALRCRPNLRKQVWSRGPQPLKGATPVARQRRFYDVSDGVSEMGHGERNTVVEAA